MYANIVVGLDCSMSSHQALRWALEMAGPTGARVRVVHVWHVETPDLYTPTVESRRIRRMAAVADAKRWCEEATGRPGPDTPHALEVVEGGSPGPRLVAAARNADLLVIGMSEHRILGRLLHGSVGHHVLAHAPCPVVMVPPPVRPRVPKAKEPVPTFSDPTELRVELPDVPRF